MSLQYALDGDAPKTYTSWSFQQRLGARQNEETALRRRSYSLLEGTQMSPRDAVMEEFRHNGIDTPYDPIEKMSRQDPGLSGLGPARRYLKQKSCPAESSFDARNQTDSAAAYKEYSASFAASLYQTDSPATSLYQTASIATNLPQTLGSASQVQQSPPGLLQPGSSGLLQSTSSTSLFHSASSAADFLLSSVPTQSFPESILPESLNETMMSDEQLRILSSIPTSALHYLLREMETRLKAKPKACRFCKNNGEREAYYSSHCLRAEGRVACPVLRALVCRQCGAHGDHAHTIKYCPLTSPSDRKQSTLMMQSKRLSSGRRRVARPAEYVRFGDSSGALQDGAFRTNTPLDPMWAALEKKLML